MRHDLRQAVRTLAKHPGFVVIASAVLALGIGLNTALFSVVHAMLHRPFPVADSHELVSIYWVIPRQPDRPHSMPSNYYEHFARYSDVFNGLTAHWSASYALRADDQTDTVRAEWVLANYFDVLGVRPVLGRTFIPAEDDPATTERAVVLSHQLWTRRFGGDPAIVGKELKLALYGRPELVYTVVGVAAEGFRGITAPWMPSEIWVTYAQNGRELRGARFSVGPIGRLKPGVTLKQAQAMVAAQGRQFYYSYRSARAESEPGFLVLPTDDVRMPFDPSAAVIPGRLAGALTIVVGTVLLIAAANIAGILLARGVGRSHEIAIRRVLGAGPLRIARQLLTESVLLSQSGGALGLVLAAWLLSLFRAFTPSEFALDVAIEARVVLFALLLCTVSAIVVGIAPALQGWRMNVLPWLSSGSVVVKPSRRRLRHAITIPQIAFSLALLLVGAAYVRSLLQLETADLGYESANVVVANATLRPDPGEDPNITDGQRAERYAARTRRFYVQLLERLRAIPGAAGVAIAARLPLSEASSQPGWYIVSQDGFLAGDRVGTPGDRTSVSPGYFRTMRIEMGSGRDFDERDTATHRKVAVVSASLAQRLWPGRDPVGQQLTAADTWNGFKDQVEWFEVVGVVEDVTPVLHERGSRPALYVSLGQEWRPSASFIVARGPGDSRTLIPSVKAAVTSSDTFADVTRATTLEQMIAAILYPRRIAGAVLSVSGMVALFLAVIGIYGVVSYSVAQRTGEIGVRMALGAERGDIVRLVLRDGGRIATAGSLVGLVLGYTASHITSSHYLALPPLDLAILVITPILLTGIVLLACYVPARRGGLIDPLEVLRR